MDESTSALDPIATLSIEELIAELKKDYTIVIVTAHNMQQAARLRLHGFILAGRTGWNFPNGGHLHQAKTGIDRKRILQGEWVSFIARSVSKMP